MVYLLCYGYHLYLHPFPTRRSSDLGSGLPAPPGSSRSVVWTCTTLRRAGEAVPAAARPPGPRHGPGWTEPVQAGGRHSRSEEHTSELQSLRHLVCRLLLEKKKKRYI